MNEDGTDFQPAVEQLVALVSQLQEALKDIPVSKKLREGIRSFHSKHEIFQQSVEGGEIEEIYENAKNVGVYGIITSQGVAETTTLDEEVKKLGQSIGAVAKNLRQAAEHSPNIYRPLEETPRTTARAPSAIPASVQKRIDQFIEDYQRHEQQTKLNLNEIDRRVSAVDGRLAELEGFAREEVKKMSAAYDAALTEIETKKEQINAILGHVSGRAIAGDYEKSATNERFAADWLRAGSLACMVLIVVVLGYSFWETATTQFEWQKSLFRVALAFLLSAPAAYLARESTKHRAQQYQHLQTSLDLKAITPYLATLPDDVQHRIKAEIASKLFSGKDFSQSSSDSYPVNTQELLMELIKKLELPKATAKD